MSIILMLAEKGINADELIAVIVGASSLDAATWNRGFTALRYPRSTACHRGFLL